LGWFGQSNAVWGISMSLPPFSPLSRKNNLHLQYLRQNENRLKTTLFLRLFSCPKMAKLEIGEGIGDQVGYPCSHFTPTCYSNA
jgi:hypothetical protein